MNKKLLIVISAVLVLAAGLGAGLTVGFQAFLAHQAKAAAALAKLPPKVIFAQMTNVTVSIPDVAGDPPAQFVVFDVQFKTTDQNAVDGFAEIDPIIRSKMITEMMAQSAKSLQDPNTRFSLEKTFLNIANSTLLSTGFQGSRTPFSDAYITNLVVQD